MIRVVIDTSVIVAGLRSRNGASFALLRYVAAKEVVPLVTSSLFLECEDVLKRPEQLQACGWTLSDVDRFLQEWAAFAEAVEVHLRWRPQLRDPGDELVLEAAVNGRADALVTHNLRDFVGAAPRFGVRVVRPHQILEELRG